MGTVILFDWGKVTAEFKERSLLLTFDPPNPTFDQFEEAMSRAVEIARERALLTGFSTDIIGPAKIVEEFLDGPRD